MCARSELQGCMENAKQSSCTGDVRAEWNKNRPSAVWNLSTRVFQCSPCVPQDCKRVIYDIWKALTNAPERLRALDLTLLSSSEILGHWQSRFQGMIPGDDLCFWWDHSVIRRGLPPSSASNRLYSAASANIIYVCGYLHHLHRQHLVALQLHSYRIEQVEQAVLNDFTEIPITEQHVAILVVVENKIGVSWPVKERLYMPGVMLFMCLLWEWSQVCRGMRGRGGGLAQGLQALDQPDRINGIN